MRKTHCLLGWGKSFPKGRCEHRGETLPEKRTATGVPRKLGARRRRQAKELFPDGVRTGLVLGWDASR